MHADVETITPSSTLAVTLAEAKAWLRVDYDTEDDLIEGLIASAQATVEAQSGVTLFHTVFDQSQAEFPIGGDSLELLRAPVVSVASVTYLDLDETEVVLDDETYRLVKRPLPSRVKMVAGYSWPATMAPSVNDEGGDGAVVVRFTAGISEDDPAEIPATLKQAVKMLVAHYFRNREATSSGPMAEVPQGVQALLDDYRVDYDV